MRAWFLGLIMLLAGGAAMPLGWGQEQPMPSPPVAATEPAKPVAGPALEGSQLDTFLLRDSKGNLVPVLGMPFEEFEQLLRLKKGLAAPVAPAYSLETLSLTGSVEGPIANLQVVATIRLRAAGWVKIPLLMPAAVLREPEKYEGPGEQLLTFDPQAGGQVLWLRGGGEVPHVVTLRVSAAVARVGDERRLAIKLPHATESSLRLTTQQPAVEASLALGEGIVASSANSAKTGEITVLGPAGELRLTWRPSRQAAQPGTLQMDASGEIAVRIESEHRITSDARLRVRGYGAPLESFHVRLPPGMELVPLPPTGAYNVTLVGASDAAPPPAKTSTAQVVLVQLEKPATSAVEVLLRAQREVEAPTKPQLLPARFEVLGASRQRGVIDFTVDGQWQLDWSEDRSVERMDLTADTAAARIVARFEYYRQPCGLALTVSSRPARVSVEPSHLVFVDRQRLRIETSLKYRFRGARVEDLRFQMGDWTFDRLAPDTLLDVPLPKDAETGEVVVPLRPGVAPPAELELKLEAHRPLANGAQRLELAFPKPVANIIAPATIAIVAADNVEVTPLVAEMSGLAADATAVSSPARTQPPLLYRDLGGEEAARFVAQLRPLSRLTTAAGKALVRIERQQAQIEQQLEYRVLHEPQRTFVLTAPRDVAATGNVQAWFGSEPLGTQLIGTSPSDPRQMLLQFSTPADQLGAFAVSLRYNMALPWDGQKSLPVTIPLVVPSDDGGDQLTSQQVEFYLPEGMQLEPEGEPGEELARPIAASGSASVAFSLLQPHHLTQWVIEPSQAAQLAGISVSQMWVQTWLGPRVRQDRVALRLLTSQETLHVRLPTGFKASSVLTAIDGQEVKHHIRETGVVVAIPVAARGRTFVLEASYTLDAPLRQLGLLHGELQTAQIDGAAPPRRVYWQLALPHSEHLLLSPDDITPEMTWSISGWPFAQRPILDQRQLEAWIKASRQDALPRGAKEYLFGTLGRWPALTVAVGQRWLLVTLASCVALTIGLVLIHVRASRGPSFFLVAAIVLAATALLAPELTWLAGQGALLGILVAIVAAAWAWVTARPGYSATSTPTLAPRSLEEELTPTPASARRERSSRITSTAAAAAPLMEARP